MYETSSKNALCPSPTGYMHIGILELPCMNILWQNQWAENLFSEYEDTDQERLVEGATDVIYNTLKLCGMHHDEGPDIGGPYAPYVQSERKDTYKPLQKN